VTRLAQFAFENFADGIPWQHGGELDHLGALLASESLAAEFDDGWMFIQDAFNL
jgi:hypothetical protein